MNWKFSIQTISLLQELNLDEGEEDSKLEWTMLEREEVSYRSLCALKGRIFFSSSLELVCVAK